MSGSGLRRLAVFAAYVAGAAASVALLLLSLQGVIDNDWTEVVAVVTGGWCVWLVVKEHIWNWPIGLANCAFTFIVYFQTRFYADAALQIVYMVLAVLGWYWWLHGGERRSRLKIVNLNLDLALVLTYVCGVSTILIHDALIVVKGTAPFLDALTTAMSLVAQFMLTKKIIENWLVWIAADAIYVPLLWSRDLHLMSGLYFVFLVMAIAGYVEWRRRQAIGAPA